MVQGACGLGLYVLARMSWPVCLGLCVLGLLLWFYCLGLPVRVRDLPGPNASGEPRQQPQRGTSGGCWRRLQCLVRLRLPHDGVVLQDGLTTVYHLGQIGLIDRKRESMCLGYIVWGDGDNQSNVTETLSFECDG